MTGKKGVCQQCGNSLGGLFRENFRKYCSKSCSWKASYRKTYPDRPHKLWVHEQSVFEAAMELHWNGEESATIARQIGIPVGTVYSWVHDFGSQRERKEPLKNLLRIAASAEEWLEALRENTLQENESFEDLGIYLVCGRLQGQSVGTLATVITESLKGDPLSGNVYAFCSKSGNTISTFAWKCPVFKIEKHIKMHGTFIWPHENLGKSIEVTKAEFDRLIFLRKREKISERTLGKSSENLDIIRVSCYN
jgi:transposase-like protein